MDECVCICVYFVSQQSVYHILIISVVTYPFIIRMVSIISVIHFSAY
jgi:hypothetical protein